MKEEEEEERNGYYTRILPGYSVQDLHEQGAIPLIIGIMERGREGRRGLERRCTCIHSFFPQLHVGLLKDIELAPPTGSHGNLITLEG